MGGGAMGIGGVGGMGGSGSMGGMGGPGMMNNMGPMRWIFSESKMEDSDFESVVRLQNSIILGSDTKE